MAASRSVGSATNVSMHSFSSSSVMASLVASGPITSRMSSTVAGRFEGSFSSSRAHRSLSSLETHPFGASSAATGGFLVKCAIASSVAVRASSGGRPVSTSNSSAPNA
jgi:hypothetical protein